MINSISIFIYLPLYAALCCNHLQFFALACENTLNGSCSKTMRYLKYNFRFHFFVLVALSILPGILLALYLVITQHNDQIWGFLLIAISSFIIAWLGGDLLILRRVNLLIALSKRLSSGELTARSNQTDHFGLFGELFQAFDQVAGSLEEKTLELHQRADEFAGLVEMAGELTTQQDLSALLQEIVEKAIVLLRVSHVTITLYDSAHNELVVAATESHPVLVGRRIRMGEGAIGRAAQTRQPIVVGDYRIGEGHTPEFEDSLFSTVTQTPMIYRGELIGVLGVAEIGPVREHGQSKIHLLSLFAGQAASAIKNTRLFEETRRRLEEFETINQISTALRVAQGIDEILPLLLERTMTMVKAIMGSIWLYEPTDNTLHQAVSDGIPDLSIHLRPGDGIIGMVFSSGQPYFTMDIREDRLTHPSLRPQIPTGLSGAYIPICTAQGIVGVLMVGFHSPHELSKDQIRLITIITEIAGSAIHRMRLHDQTKSQLQKLSALHQIDLAITSSLDIGNTLQVLLDQVITQLGVDAACVLVHNPHEQMLEFATSRGFITDALRHTRLRFGEGHAGMAALEQRTLHISDLNTHQVDFLRSPSFASEGFVTYYAAPLVIRSQVKGVLEVFHRSPIERDRDWLDFLEALASQAAIAIENASLFNDLQRSNIELNLAYDSTLEGWSRALDLHDRETENHTQRVTQTTLRLARAMSVDESDLVQIRRGALLHDIGKLGIPDNILLKPGPLNDEERIIIQKHPMLAFEMLAPILYLRPALDIPYCHHEKWDGSGYPRGLKGEQIPLAARIFAVVDVWDALLSNRPYKKSWSNEKVRAHLQEQAGHHFDPRVVEAFITLLNKDENVQIV
jgi:response regulator RpfG family c-di-GMP phosphodiesterase